MTASRWEKGRVLVVQPERELEKGTSYVVRVKAGVVAGEAPLGTKAELQKSFTTYGPLKVVELRCGWSGEVCRPNTSKWLRLTNSVKSEGLEKLITVRPAVAGWKPHCSGSYCYIQAGEWQAQTKYQVTVGAGLEDVYDQKLGAPWTGSLYVGDAMPELTMPVSGHLAVTEQQGNRQLALQRSTSDERRCG